MGFKSLEELRQLSDDIKNEEETNGDETKTPEADSVKSVQEETPADETTRDDENSREGDEGDISSGTKEEPKEEPKEDDEEKTVEDTSEQEGDFNFTYKSLGEEREFDSFLKSAIKNKEQEEIVRRLYQKSNGMERFETKFNKAKEENEELMGYRDTASNLQREMDYYNTLLQKGEHHTFFKNIGITDDQVLETAHKIIQFRDLTPTQQTAYNNNIQSTQELYNLKQQTQQLQEQLNTQGAAAQAASLDRALSAPDVTSIINDYNTTRGKEGAFREEVINHAAYIENSTRNNPNGPTILTPEQAIDDFLNVIGRKRGEVPQTVASSSTSQPRVIEKKPTMPNVSGSGKSPVKRVPRSLADLRKLAEEAGEY